MTKTVQQVLFMHTEYPNLRSEAIGWTAEDPRLYVAGKAVGSTPSPKFPYTYSTPLEALADGWKLLSPPSNVATGTALNTWGWLFGREVER